MHIYIYLHRYTEVRTSHCVFSDHGCGIICSLKEKNDWILTDIARSVHLFVDAVANQIPFDRSHFQIGMETRIKLYSMNEEQLE